MLQGYDEVAVLLGLDVGKEGHHAVAQDRTGKKPLDRALPNDEARLRELLGRMKAHGPVLLVVDQPATIGALPVAVALDEGVTVAYLPDLAMRRVADVHPGAAKIGARDAAVIANAARTMPHTLRALQLDDETIAELTVLSGFDATSPGRSPRRPAAASVACSPRSILRWSASSGRGWTTRPCLICSKPGPSLPLSPLRGRPGCGRACARILTEVVGKDAPTAGTSFPTPAWPQLPADLGSPSAANTHPAAATKSSNAPCSCPRSRPCITLSPGLTTTGNELSRRSTTKPS